MLKKLNYLIGLSHNFTTFPVEIAVFTFPFQDVTCENERQIFKMRNITVFMNLKSAMGLCLNKTKSDNDCNLSLKSKNVWEMVKI